VSESRRRLPFLLVGAAAAAADLVTKSWVFAAIPYQEPREVIRGFFYLKPHYNPAGPWSWGLGLPLEARRWMLPAISVIAVVVLVRILLRTDPADRLKALGFVLILGGAAGNLWDRARAAFDPGFAGVRDFLYFPTIVFGDAFPAFNLADTWITVGVVLVGWRLLREGGDPAPGTTGATAAPDEARA